jgi:chromosome segregation ATPase
LLNAYKTNPDISGEDFVNILYSLYEQLKSYNFKFSKLNSSNLYSEQQTALRNDLFDIIYDEYQPFIQYAASRNIQAAIDLNSAFGIIAMQSGSSLRNRLGAVQNQFAYNEDELKLLVKAFSKINTNDLVRALNDLKKEIKKITDEYKKAHEKLDSHKKEHSDKIDKLNELDEQKRIAAKKLEEVNKRIAELEKSKVDNKKVQSELEKRKNELNQISSNLQNINSEIQKLEKESRALDDQIKKEQNAINTIDVDYKKATTVEELLNSKDIKDQAKAVLLMTNAKSQMPAKMKKIVDDSELKKLTKETLQKYGSKMNLTSKGKL